MSPPPTHPNSLIHYIFSMVKAHLMRVKVKRQHQQQRVDLMEWRNEVTEFLPFPARALTELYSAAEYSLQDGTTEHLDYYLGKKWDLVANNQLIVAKIAFRKKPFCSVSYTCKLGVYLDMIAFSENPEVPDYRSAATEHAEQHERLYNDDGDDGTYELIL